MDNAHESKHFIEDIIDRHNENGRFDSRVKTRFPPEPNGYLHIGHAKSICLNFTVAQKYGGTTNLRFDDTNPTTEETEYVESIKRDVQWLGFDWEGEARYASDYFEELYEAAVKLVKKGVAYVDDSTSEEMAEMKGTPTRPGTNSPYRDRPVEENLRLLEGMKNGEYPEGSRTLRAKIDMASDNMIMRDPVIYRIKRVPHHRTGDTWNIYPMYDLAHCMSDSIENITHSLCTLEFEVHRPLYDWILDQLDYYHPQQIEFARLNLSYTITSKRKLLNLVAAGHVTGWDDPRMPTISGMRRRGYTPAAIREFCDRVGVARRENLIDVALLEFAVRDDLNKTAPRYMAVLDPLKLTITNYPKDKTEWVEVVNNPEDESQGTREMPFSNEIYIEHDDFMEDPPRKYFRLKPGGMVRLKGAYIVQCDEVIKDEYGKPVELKCTYIPESKSGEDTSGLKVKGTLHWVSRKHAIPAQARLYDRLFFEENPTADADRDYMEFFNASSLQVLDTIYVEPALKDAQAGDRMQFLRKGYYCVDPDSTEDKLVFNRTVTLRDGWAKK